MSKVQKIVSVLSWGARTALAHPLTTPIPHAGLAVGNGVVGGLGVGNGVVGGCTRAVLSSFFIAAILL